MNIRRIDTSEIDLVIDLFDEYRVFYKQSSNIKLAKQFLTERLSRKESVIFLASESTESEMVPMGFTQLYPTYSSVQATKNWILNDLYVNQSHRLKGVANQLIQAAMHFAKTDGVNFVELSTAVDNFSAQQLYEKIGFQKQPTDKHFFTYRISV